MPSIALCAQDCFVCALDCFECVQDCFVCAQDCFMCKGLLCVHRIAVCAQDCFVDYLAFLLFCFSSSLKQVIGILVKTALKLKMTFL